VIFADIVMMAAANILKKGGKMDFNGKIVVVTGAASGIGRETARAFASRGADLALADINEEGLQKIKKELESQGRKVFAQVVDVSVAEQVEDFCDKVYEEMGRVDILCNNAGIAIAGRLEDLTLADWQEIIAVNLWGVIYGCHYFYPRMIEQGGGGHIVNTASGAGLAPLNLLVAYCTTKYGVVGFSETLRAEAALHGIRVSALCPGIVITNITKTSRMTTDTAHSTSDELMEKMHSFYTWRNYTPDKVAAAVVRGVEKNIGIIRAGAETYIGDWMHRLSRRLLDAFTRSGVKFMLERL